MTGKGIVSGSSAGGAIRIAAIRMGLSYTTARLRVRAAGDLIGIQLKPHDLRRHCATFASRSGTPIEIVSKVILRHTNLSTTQMYLGKVSDLEALRWVENLHG